MDFSHTIFVSRLHAPRTVYCQALAALSDFVDLDHAIVTARDNCLSFLMMSNPLRFSDQQQIVTLMQPPEPSPPFGPKIDPGTDADTDPSSASKPENAIGIEVPQLDQAPRLSPINPMAAVLLLDVAAEHLARKGPHRLTVSAVAAGSGMTHANVYRYYPSKEGLIDAVIGRWLRSIEVELARIVEGPDPVEDKIEHLLVALATRQSDALIHDPHIFAVHLDAVLKDRVMARKHRTRLRGLVERVIEEGIASSAFAARNKERAIAYVFDASYRFTHPVGIQLDVDLPRDLAQTRLGGVTLSIRQVLRTGTL
ncbi:TetR/AcrR family transcriptional regulator [uncultured Methylobacterium sp.]|jgi:AcrR family transcriptional regulator|uniref:TetR/AcrR family transcriptional regulator n=2 Tax=Bacteria TaxID=2 RepID=UPI002615FDEF|nr:TetR/AcrR family transcriptional regulator [uncultured Methylobacterium sp.]